jgi:hypothetical protein
MKFDLSEIQMVLNENIKDPEVKKAILKDIEKLEADKKAEKEEEKADKPKSKNKHVFFVRKDEKDNYSEGGFLAKCPINRDNNDILNRIQTAAAQQNDQKKSNRGRKSKAGRIEKYYDFFFGAKRKFTKGVDVQPIAELVEIVILPSEEIDFSK